MELKHKSFRRLFALLLCLGLLSGCGGEGGASDRPQESTEPPAQSTEPAETPEQSTEPAETPEQSAEPSEAPEESTPEPVQEDDSWKDVLLSIPYHGDVESCAMTADQALAYAQLLEDGIAGKVPADNVGYDSNLPADSSAYDPNAVACWDKPFNVWGPGTYQTNRANAILGSFAGDGQPYLCVFSSSGMDFGFDVYYSDGGDAKFVYGNEVYGAGETSFGLDADGKMTISEFFVGGGGTSAARYVLENGAAKSQHSWRDESDFATGGMRVTEDGVETLYTIEEFMNLDGPDTWEALPSAPYASIPLRDMIAFLNEYAAAKGSGTLP